MQLVMDVGVELDAGSVHAERSVASSDPNQSCSAIRGASREKTQIANAQMAT